MRDDSPPAVMVGRHDGDHVLINVLGRLHPGAVDSSDGNWLMTPIEISVGAFKAEIGASLRAEELRAFRLALESLAAALEGEAVLESMETWITLRVSVDRLGRLEVVGEAADKPGSENHLAFRVSDLDQSDLSDMIASLRSVNDAFPVVGEQ
jgi:hypothetical protein